VSQKLAINPPFPILGIIGAGGFGREVMESLLESRFQGTEVSTGNWKSVCFVEDEPTKKNLNGVQIKKTSDFLSASDSHQYFSVCISDSKIRERFTRDFLGAGLSPVSIIHNAASLHETTKIGLGAVICNSTIITSDSVIGQSFHANYFTYVAHDCLIGSFVTLGPRATINGNVQIGDHAYIGAGAVIRQGTPQKKLVIGKNAIVGMGAIVTRDVPDWAVVVGNPARILRFVDH
jgi:sugar O-acyltransferase (sialic acid O-acetyltransferase NeuD family)